MQVIKPRRLTKGSTVGIVSPSSGAAAAVPHIYDNGLFELKRLGFRVKELPNARADGELLYRNPRLRAEDINLAFADPEIDAIVTSIGGDDSVRILPYVNPQLAISNPKLLMGFSDATTILTYMALHGIVTFYGPSVMAGFSQLASLPSEFKNHLQTILFDDSAGYRYSAYPTWSEGYPEWSNPANTGKVNHPTKNESGWHWLQGANAVRGRTWGGCLEVLEDLKGTRYWPESDFWNERVLFFETSEDKPSIELVTHMVRNYGMQGILEKAGAVLLGRPRDYSQDEKEQLERSIVRIISQEFGRNDMPIVTNVDFGHTDPQLILPIGVLFEIDPSSRSITLLESPFS